MRPSDWRVAGSILTPSCPHLSLSQKVYKFTYRQSHHHLTAIIRSFVSMYVSFHGNITYHLSEKAITPSYHLAKVISPLNLCVSFPGNSISGIDNTLENNLSIDCSLTCSYKNLLPFSCVGGSGSCPHLTLGSMAGMIRLMNAHCPHLREFVEGREPKDPCQSKQHLPICLPSTYLHNSKTCNLYTCTMEPVGMD